MDPRVTELHCIMPVANVGSVLVNGILSHDRAAKLAHASVAAQEVQDRRNLVQVPGGLKLHQYANLYFNARNPMMYKRRAEAGSLCVLRVSTEVCALEGAVITDCNASSDYVRFLGPSQHALLDFDDIYSANWTHTDCARYLQHKSRMCAEVLIPDRVLPDYIRGAYVANGQVLSDLSATGFELAIAVEPRIFFR